MAEILLESVATDTLDIANDLLWFNDVSETPDAINKTTLASMLSANKIAARTALEVDPTDNALYIDDFANLQAAFDAFEIATETLLLGTPGATYTITANTTLDALVEKIIDFRGATIELTGGTPMYGVSFTGIWSNCVFQNAHITSDLSTGSFAGILWGSTVNSLTLRGCTFDSVAIGLEYQGSGYPNANHIIGNRFTSCSQKALLLGGEYSITSQNVVYANADIGIFVTGGNNLIVGNSVAENDIGIWVEGTTSANADHGTIIGNLVNHNHKVGIYLTDTDFQYTVTGNQIAANGSTGAENLGSAPQDSSFGIYIKAGHDLMISNNDFLRNKFNLAVEGITNSSITDNTFTTDTGNTTNHIKEVGGTNSAWTISGNTFQDNLFGGATPIDVTTATVLQQAGLTGVLPKTSAFTIKNHHARTKYTNEGATARQDFTLPAAFAGMEFSFYVADTDGLRVIAGTGDTIRIGASVSAAAGRIDSTTIGNAVRLVAINATEWVAFDATSGWTVT